MRSFVSRSRPSPLLLVLLTLAAGCSRTDDRVDSPAASNPAATAPVAGGPTTLKPGQWKTVTQMPTGAEESTQCVGEGFDPGAEAAQKASPCGKPEMTRTADGFALAQSCEKDRIKYSLTGAVRGDFVTTATTDLELVLSAYGRKQTLRLHAISTYQGPCQPTGKTDVGTPAK
jgi:hypothetical protein